ncbi:hypothetical protein A2U01_0031027, partial [Trifolium medium]|nr:hypothetical protein [Trifolium medium]
PTLNPKMVSEPPPRSAGPPAIRFLIGPPTIYISAPSPHRSRDDFNLPLTSRDDSYKLK